MPYNYFVSYWHGGHQGVFGFGRCDLTTEWPINSIDRIEHVERLISLKNSAQNIIIINFKQFDHAPAPEDDVEEREEE